MYRALIIANWEYPDDENLSPLNGPRHDAAAMYSALTDPRAGLFSDKEVIQLRNQKQDIIARSISSFLRGGREEDTLLIYYSGHGWPRGEKLYLCASDTQIENLWPTAIPTDHVQEAIDESLAKTVITILDCCYASRFGKGFPLPDALGVMPQSSGRFLLAAGHSIVEDAKVSDVPSPFTRDIVTVLASGRFDHDSDGYTSFGDLCSYVDKRSRFTGRTRPTRHIGNAEAIDPFIARAFKAERSLLHPSANLSDTIAQHRHKTRIPITSLALIAITLLLALINLVSDNYRRLGGVNPTISSTVSNNKLNSDQPIKYAKLNLEIAGIVSGKNFDAQLARAFEVQIEKSAPGLLDGKVIASIQVYAEATGNPMLAIANANKLGRSLRGTYPQLRETRFQTFWKMGEVKGRYLLDITYQDH